MAQDNIKDLYDALSREYDLGKESEFRAQLNDKNYVKQLYGELKEEGYEDDFLTDEKAFSAYLAPTTSSPVEKPAENVPNKVAATTPEDDQEKNARAYYEWFKQGLPQLQKTARDLADYDDTELQDELPQQMPDYEAWKASIADPEVLARYQRHGDMLATMYKNEQGRLMADYAARKGSWEQYAAQYDKYKENLKPYLDYREGAAAVASHRLDMLTDEQLEAMKSVLPKRQVYDLDENGKRKAWNGKYVWKLNPNNPRDHRYITEKGSIVNWVDDNENTAQGQLETINADLTPDKVRKIDNLFNQEGISVKEVKSQLRDILGYSKEYDQEVLGEMIFNQWLQKSGLEDTIQEATDLYNKRVEELQAQRDEQTGRNLAQIQRQNPYGGIGNYIQARGEANLSVDPEMTAAEEAAAEVSKMVQSRGMGTKQVQYVMQRVLGGLQQYEAERQSPYIKDSWFGQKAARFYNTIVKGLKDNVLVEGIRAAMSSDYQKRLDEIADQMWMSIKDELTGTDKFLSYFEDPASGFISFMSEIPLYMATGAMGKALAEGAELGLFARQMQKDLAVKFMAKGMEKKVAKDLARKVSLRMLQIRNMDKVLPRMLGTGIQSGVTFGAADAVKHPVEEMSVSATNRDLVTEDNPTGSITEHILQQEAMGKPLTDEEKAALYETADGRKDGELVKGTAERAFWGAAAGGALAIKAPFNILAYGKNGMTKLATNVGAFSFLEVPAMTATSWLEMETSGEMDKMIAEENVRRKREGMNKMTDDEVSDFKWSMWWQNYRATYGQLGAFHVGSTVRFLGKRRYNSMEISQMLNDRRAELRNEGKEPMTARQEAEYVAELQQKRIWNPFDITQNIHDNIADMSRTGRFEKEMAWTQSERRRLTSIMPDYAKALSQVAADAKEPATAANKIQHAMNVQQLQKTMAKALMDMEIPERLKQKMLYRMTGMVYPIGREEKVEIRQENGIYTVRTYDMKGSLLDMVETQDVEEARAQVEEIQKQIEKNQFDNLSQQILNHRLFDEGGLLQDNDDELWQLALKMEGLTGNEAAGMTDEAARRAVGQKILDAKNKFDNYADDELYRILAPEMGDEAAMMIVAKRYLQRNLVDLKTAREKNYQNLTASEQKTIEAMNMVITEKNVNNKAFEKVKQDVARELGITADQLTTALEGHSYDEAKALSDKVVSIGNGMYRTEAEQKAYDATKKRMQDIVDGSYVPEEAEKPAKQPEQPEISPIEQELASGAYTGDTHYKMLERQMALDALTAAGLKPEEAETIAADEHYDASLRQAAQKYLNATEELGIVNKVVMDKAAAELDAETARMDLTENLAEDDTPMGRFIEAELGGSKVMVTKKDPFADDLVTVTDMDGNNERMARADQLQNIVTESRDERAERKRREIIGKYQQEVNDIAMGAKLDPEARATYEEQYKQNIQAAWKAEAERVRIEKETQEKRAQEQQEDMQRQQEGQPQQPQQPKEPQQPQQKNSDAGTKTETKPERKHLPYDEKGNIQYDQVTPDLAREVWEGKNKDKQRGQWFAESELADSDAEIDALLKKRQNPGGKDANEKMQLREDIDQQIAQAQKRKELAQKVLETYREEQKNDSKYTGIIVSEEAIRMKANEPELYDFLNELSKKMGIRLNFAEAMKNSFGQEIDAQNHMDGLIELNTLSRGNDITPEQKVKLYKNYVASVFGHELTHTFFKKNPEAMKRFVAEVREYLGEDEFSKIFNGKLGDYEKVLNNAIAIKEQKLGRKMTDAEKERFKKEYIEEEIGCDMAGQLLSDEVFISKLLGREVQRAIDGKQSWGSKLKDLYLSIKDAFIKMRRYALATGKQPQEVQEHIESMQQLWTDVYNKTKKEIDDLEADMIPGMQGTTDADAYVDDKAANRKAALDKMTGYDWKLRAARYEYSRYGLEEYFSDESMEPQNIEEFVSRIGKNVLAWESYEDPKTGKMVRGLQDELGRNMERGKEGDTKGIQYFLAAKGKGMDINDFVHELFGNRINEDWTDVEIKETLLRVLSESQNASETRNMIFNNRLALAEAEARKIDEMDYEQMQLVNHGADITAEANRKFSIVKNPELKKQLEEELGEGAKFVPMDEIRKMLKEGKDLSTLGKGYTLMYRAARIINGKVYSPKMSKLGGVGNEIMMGEIEQSDERPDLAFPVTLKDGTTTWKVDLDGGDPTGGNLKERSTNGVNYNPYLHLSSTMMNDQFSAAFAMPEMGVIEVRVPLSELYSAYKAEKAAGQTGAMPWHSGTVNGKLKPENKRTVVLSRYDMPVRIVPTDEVVDHIAKILKDNDVEMPYNLVTPQVAEGLVRSGAKVSDKHSGTVAKGQDEAWLKMRQEIEGEMSQEQKPADGKVSLENSDKTKSMIGRSLSSSEVDELVKETSGRAQTMPKVEYSPENWIAEFGEDATLDTPLGKVKLSNNQYTKEEQLKRKEEIGGIRPTLTDPDFIYEVSSKAKDGKETERESTYIFIKTFKGKNGKKQYFFKSVTNKVDGLEVNMSNHFDRLGRIKRDLEEGKLLWKYSEVTSDLSDSNQGLYNQVENSTESTMEGRVNPQSLGKGTENNPNNQIKDGKLSISPQKDADYLSAVEKGDTEKAEEMVKEAAKAAMPETKVVDEKGMPMVVYHGTQHMEMYVKDGHLYTRYTEPFTVFKEGRGFFTGDKDAAESFARGKQGLYSCYLNITNPFIIDCKNSDWDAIEGYENPDGYRRVTTDYIVQDIKNNHPEYDGVIFKNVMNENSGVVEYPIDDYIPFHPEQIKSADPVTYDDAGKMIPLSERFNEEKDDIRFSVKKTKGDKTEFKYEDDDVMNLWHGSAADIDHFDHRFFRTGEGSMVYGSGHYASNVEGTGRLYANIATENRQRSNAPMIEWKGQRVDFSDANPLRMAFDVVDSSRTIAEARQRADRYRDLAEDQEMKDKWQAAYDILKQSKKSDFKKLPVRGNRHLYQVEVPADNGKNYIDWNGELDKGIRKQIEDKLINEEGYPEYARPYLFYDGVIELLAEEEFANQEELRNYLIENDYLIGDNSKYSSIFRTLSRYYEQDEISNMLSEMGIVGVKVPTGNNQGGDGRGMNYVIFKDDDIRIKDHIRFSIIGEKGANEAQKSAKSIAEAMGKQKAVVMDTEGMPILEKDGGDIRFSFNSRKAEQELLDAVYRTNAGKWAKQDLEDMRKVGEAMMDKVEELMKEHAAFADWNKRMVLTDKNGNPVYSVFLRNNDTQAPTIELSYNCVKKEAMNSLLSILREEGNLSKLNNLKYLDLREILKKHGYAIACEMCYVESKRENVEAKQRLATEWNNIIKAVGLSKESFIDLPEDGEGELTDKQRKALEKIIKSNKPGSKTAVAAQLMLDNPSLRGMMDYTQLYTPEGWDKLLRRYGDKHRFMTWLAAHDGSATAKPTFGSHVFSQERFMQEYGNLSRYFGEAGIKFGGFRKHSYSDADPLLFVDDYQIHENLALTKSGMFGYTKVPYYVDMWGETGEFINQSLVVDIDTNNPEPKKYAGLIKVGDERHQKALGMSDAEYETYKTENGLKDGDYDYYYADESFPVAKAMQNRGEQRFGGRVGNVLVSASDEMTRKALDDPRIDVIIGWHSTNKMIQAKERTGYEFATDHSGSGVRKAINETIGNEGKTNSTTYLPGMKVIAPTYTDGEGKKARVKFNYNEACQMLGDARQAANAYLEWCDINGFRPMYPQFREHPNYYKLLADFRRYDNEGNPLVQGAIEMKLPEAWAEKLDSYLSERESEYKKNTSEMAKNTAFLDDVRKAMNGNKPDGGGDGHKFSISVQKADPFYSNAAKAVEGIKQEKATAEQWLKMIEKVGGLKKGEDKWMGLSEWLKQQNALAMLGDRSKTLTRQEVMDFISKNAIKVEEVNYNDKGNASFGYNYENNRYELYGDDSTYYKNDGYTYNAYVKGEEIGTYYNEREAQNAINSRLGGSKQINETRLTYTTRGLENKKEIALTVPAIEPYNETDNVHFGDAGEGRAVAWVRFGDTTDADGSHVLVIDEIQSKRHQDGREKGYLDSKKIAQIDKEIKELHKEQVRAVQTGNATRYREIKTNLSKLATEKMNLMQNIPDAPFDKNWHELAMKRMLRYAAENGYDKVAWTTGAQQTERYNLGEVVEQIDIWDWNDDERSVFLRRKGARASENIDIDRDGNIIYSSHPSFGEKGQNVSAIYGKELSARMLGENAEKINDLTVFGGEGMKGFYDQMLPKFMQKYGKKWGAKVGEVELDLPNEADRKMWSVDVTDSMRESVMEGQPMFSISKQKESGNELLDEARKIAAENRAKRERERVNTNPTEAQKAAGNYKHGHKKVDGYDISIENPKGSTRSGKDADGKEWSIKMQHDYGYIRGTEGVDGDHIDVYLSDNPESGNVYVVDQIDQKTGAFDEHKVMYGFDSREEAEKAYLEQYQEGWKMGTMTEVSKDEFRKWVNSSHRKTKAFADYKSVKADDTRYSLIGEKGAKNLDLLDEAKRINQHNKEEKKTRLDNKAMAEQMEKEGKDADAIWLATGWNKGKDGKWRYEVDDMRMTDEKYREFISMDIPEDHPEDVEWEHKMKLGDLVEAEDLFGAYPELRDVDVVFEYGWSGNKHGAYSASDNAIRLNISLVNEFGFGKDAEPLNKQLVEDTMIHETQHAIQHIEGFAKGGSIGMKLRGEDIANNLSVSDRTRYKEIVKRMVELDRESQELMDKYDETGDKSYMQKSFDNQQEYDKLEAEADKLLEDVKKELGIKGKLTFDDYRRLAGEVEARNATERNGRGEFWRKENAPSETEDTEREEQIVRYAIRKRKDETDAEYDARRREYESARAAVGDKDGARKAIIDQIKSMLDNKNIPSMTKGDLNRLMRRVQNAAPENLSEGIREAQRVLNRINTRIMGKELHDLLNLKVQDRNGKNMSVAKNVDDNTRRILEDVRDKMYGLVRTDLDDAMDDLRAENSRMREENRVLSVRIDRGDFEENSKEWTDAQQKILDNESKMEANNSQIERMKKDRREQVLNDVGFTLYDIQERMNRKLEYMEQCSNGEAQWTPEDQRELATLEILKARLEVEQTDEEHRDWERQYRDASDNRQRRSIMTVLDSIEDERLKKVRIVVDKIRDLIEGGKNTLAYMKQQEMQHNSDLVHNMMGDIRGKHMPSDPEKAKKSSKADSWKALVTSPLKSFEYMAHAIDRNHFSRDGWFYKYFVSGKHGVMAAENDYLTHYRETMQKLNEKTEEIFGAKATKVSDEGRKQTTVHGITLIDDEGNRFPLSMPNGLDEAAPLSRNQATYLYMVWKMADGRAKMEAMGFDETSMSEVEEFIGEDYMTWADYVQEEYLPSLFPRYNQKYIEIYGTSMADIEHYVPLKINGSEVRIESNMNDDKVGKNVLSKKNGFQINRTINLKPIDLTTDCFQVIQEHIQQAEDFNAYASVRKDLDAIFSSNAVVNQLNYNSNGSARELQKAAMVATHAEIPEEVSSIERGILKLTRGIVGTNIAWRIGTAMKQTLSAPVFYGYTYDPRFTAIMTKSLVKNFVLNMPGVVEGIFIGKDNVVKMTDAGSKMSGFYGDFKWAMDNVPSFRNRVSEGTMGMDIFDGGFDQTVFDKYMSRGMAANQLIDAVTCVSGIKGIYDYNMMLLKKRVDNGEMTQEEAHRKAIMEADIFYNGTQQSSHKAFLSPLQSSNSYMAKSLMAYQNASTGFARKAIENLTNFGKIAHWQKLERNYMNGYMALGHSEEEAKQMTRKAMWHQVGKSMVGLAMFGFLGNYLWDLGGRGLFGFLQSDEQEEEGFKLTNIPSYFIRGNVGTDILNALLGGNVRKPFLFYNELEDDLKQIEKLNQKYGGVSPQLAVYVLSKGLRVAGIDLETLTNIYLGAEDLIRQGKSCNEVMLNIEFMINLSKTNRKSTTMEMYKDMEEDEQLKAVLRAEKVFEKDDWRRFLPGAKELTESKYNQLRAELAKVRASDKDHPLTEAEATEIVKTLNTEEDLRDMYDSSTDALLREKIITKANTISKEKEFSEMTWEQRAKAYRDKQEQKLEKKSKKGRKAADGKTALQKWTDFDDEKLMQRVEEYYKKLKDANDKYLELPQDEKESYREQHKEELEKYRQIAGRRKQALKLRNSLAGKTVKEQRETVDEILKIYSEIDKQRE